MSRLASTYFSSNGSWVAPAGVTRVYLLGQGGGAGGSGGGNGAGGGQRAGGGGGTVPYLVQVAVVPNTSYTVTIGGGGSGAAGSATINGTPTTGGTGISTTFGALWTFAGAKATINSSTNTTVLSGTTINQVIYNSNDGSTVGILWSSSGFVVQNLQTGGDVAGPIRGGIQGCAGYAGSAGGNGSAGVLTGINGTPGSNGTGFGAGGGGGGGSGTATGGDGATGGNGSGGQLWVMWVE